MMKRSLPILNYADIISQTMSFTIAYTWRESIRDFVKDLCPQSLITGPVGAIIFAMILTMFIIVTTVLMEQFTHIGKYLYDNKFKSPPSTKKEDDDDDEEDDDDDDD